MNMVHRGIPPIDDAAFKRTGGAPKETANGPTKIRCVDATKT